MTQDNNEKKTKVCSKCGRELPKTMFSIKRAAKDGLQTVCKECQSEYWKNRSKKDNADTKVTTSPVAPKSTLDKNNRPLIGFHAREIIAELRFRGYHGKLHLTKSIDV